MAKFHFEIVDGIKIEDPVGMDCKSEAQAIDVARSIARQIEIDVKVAAFETFWSKPTTAKKYTKSRLREDRRLGSRDRRGWRVRPT
jgi:hypothetical protein